MKKLYFLLAVAASFAAGPSLTGSEIEKTHNKVQDAPGTRCTRLRYDPKAQANEITAVGSRCSRFQQKPPKGVEFLPNTPPKLGLSTSSSHLGQGAPPEVKLQAIACDLENDNLLYTYTATGGRIADDGANAVWSLDGVRPGSYTVTVEADDGCGCITFTSASVIVEGGQ